MQKNRGFTLIELMVTIAVLAVIAMMAAPSFGDLIATKKLDMSARDLSLLLGQTRGQSVALRKDITLKFETGTNTDTTYFWLPKDENITFYNQANDVDYSDVVFTVSGVSKQRTKFIDNPICKDEKLNPNPCVAEPELNPEKLEVLLPLKFELCNKKINKSRIISMSASGTLDRIESGVCS